MTTASAKIAGHGQAAILDDPTLELLFSDGFKSNRDRALFGICLFTAVRIGEACSLLAADIFDQQRQVRPVLTVRRANTKGKLATRAIPVHPELKNLLTAYESDMWEGSLYLFPGRHTAHLWAHLQPESAHRLLRLACRRLGIEGVSTHSFRRTALTRLSNAGVPLRVIQEISGHSSLAVLSRYLEVTDRQVSEAILSLPVLGSERDRKGRLVNLEPEMPDTPLVALGKP